MAQLIPSRTPQLLSGASVLTSWMRMRHFGRVRMKRRFEGLYDGKIIQFGNNVSWSKRR